jgi:hypothetical protein
MGHSPPPLRVLARETLPEGTAKSRFVHTTARRPGTDDGLAAAFFERSGRCGRRSICLRSMTRGEWSHCDSQARRAARSRRVAAKPASMRRFYAAPSLRPSGRRSGARSHVTRALTKQNASHLMPWPRVLMLNLLTRFACLFDNNVVGMTFHHRFHCRLFVPRHNDEAGEMRRDAVVLRR